jgi:hypothetical protein
MAGFKLAFGFSLRDLKGTSAHVDSDGTHPSSRSPTGRLWNSGRPPLTGSATFSCDRQFDTGIKRSTPQSSGCRGAVHGTLGEAGWGSLGDFLPSMPIAKGELDPSLRGGRGAGQLHIK